MSARQFTGNSGDYIEKVTPSGVLVDPAWTFGAWVYRPTGSTSRMFLRLGTDDGGPTRGVNLGLNGSGALYFRSASNFVNGGTALAVDAWSRIGFTRAGTGASVVSAILNGAVDASANRNVSTEITAGDPFRLSAANGFLGYTPFNGRMAWAFWLQGVALSASEMDGYLQDPQSLIDDYGPSGTVAANALKLLWPLQCDTATEEDVSGVGNDGTRNGTVDLTTGPTLSTPWDVCASPAPPRITLSFRPPA